MSQMSPKTRVPKSIIEEYRTKAEHAVRMAATLFVILDIGENYAFLETANMDGSRIKYRYVCD